MPKTVLRPTNAQIYVNYRRSLIERHICSNGLLLSLGLWLVEKDPSGVYSIPPELEPIARDSIEELAGTNQQYHYVAYPLVIPNEDHPDGYLVAGGGDNPLLYGGLAMATFCMEDLKKVSKHSFNYAKKLLDFFLISELKNESGKTGFLLRKRHYWWGTKQASSDELCGVLIGLFFYIKAAKQRNDTVETQKATDLLRRIATHLKKNNYMYKPPPGSGGFESNPDHQRAWVYQFPFSRIFKEHLDDSYRSSYVIPPEEAGVFQRAFPVQTENQRYLLAIFNHLTGDPFATEFTSKDLFLGVLRFNPGVYAATGGENFYNLTMAAYCTLMVLLPDVVDYEVKKEIANQAELCFLELCRFPEAPAYENAFFSLVAKLCAEYREYSFFEGAKRWASDHSLGLFSGLCRAASYLDNLGRKASEHCEEYEWEAERGECIEKEDRGYNRCTQQRDDGYWDCDDWWWWLEWICNGWVWIKNLVCVARVWVENLVCVAWAWTYSHTCKAVSYIISLFTWPIKQGACSRDGGWDAQIEEIIDCLVHPKDLWFHDLPLGEPKPAPHRPFNPFSTTGKFLLGGETFTWVHPDHLGHTFTYRKEMDIEKVTDEFGPVLESWHKEFVVITNAEGNDIPKPGPRLESTGLGLLFPRMLMAYLDLESQPILTNDIAFPTFPFKGPEPSDPNMTETNRATEVGRRKRTGDWLLLSSSM